MKEIILKIKSVDYNNVTDEIVNEIANEISLLDNDSIRDIILFMVDDTPITGNNGKCNFYNKICENEKIVSIFETVSLEIIEDNTDFVNPNGYLTKDDLDGRIYQLELGKNKYNNDVKNGVIFTEKENNYWTNTVDFIIEELSSFMKK